MLSPSDQGAAPEKARLLLYINGVLAVRTIQLDADERAARIENWGRIYGPRPRIEVEAA